MLYDCVEQVERESVAAVGKAVERCGRGRGAGWWREGRRELMRGRRLGSVALVWSD